MPDDELEIFISLQIAGRTLFDEEISDLNDMIKTAFNEWIKKSNLNLLELEGESVCRV